MRPSSPKQLAARIRRLREQSRLTQTQFARKLGVSQQKLSNWENGKSLRGLIEGMRLSQLLDRVK